MEEKHIGLSSRQVEESRAKYGSNALSVKESATFWQMFKETFKDIWIQILCLALVVELVIYGLSFIYPDYFHEEPIEILGVALAILLSTIFSAITNYRNEQAFNTLQAEASKIQTKVYRDGNLIEVSIDDLVKGDVVLIQAGDQIPVDGILVSGDLTVNQASLNGESRDAKKEPAPKDFDASKEDTDFENPYWVYRGSVATSGEAKVQALVIGDNSVLGGISRALGEEEKQSPSTYKMEILAKQVGKLGLMGAVITVVANLVFAYFDNEFASFAAGLALVVENIMLFISIIIMAVPEGLPLMNALVAGMNSGRMLKENILVRHAESIETAGYMNLLFSDKTGTITQGVLSVVDWIDHTGKISDKIDSFGAELKKELINGIGLNNDAFASEGKAIGSNGTDRALMNYLILIGESDLNRDVILSKEPFDSRKKCARVILKECSYLKGAPDFFLDSCKHYINDQGKIEPLSQKDLEGIEASMHEQMARSMRLLLIMKEVPGIEGPIYLGIVCIRDNVRSDVNETVKRMNRAGCTVVMVTGDNKETALAIAKDAGILKNKSDVVLTSDELAKLSDEEVKKILPDLRVVARARPLDKKRLVNLAQELEMVCGMTGDGVNDSPALKAADVGFAMGDGTSVAKDASDIVIVNNSLTSISNAIKYGRTMSKSVKKFIIFQLTVNVSTILINVVAPFLGFSEPFTIVQILWINLIMDTLAALAFGEEPPLDRYMDEKPISRLASVLTDYMKGSIGTAAVYILIVAVFLYTSNFLPSIGLDTPQLERTFVFTFFIYAIIFNSLNTRSTGYNLFEHISENRKFMLVMTGIFIMQTVLIYFGGAIFNTVPMPLNGFLWALALGFLIIPVDLIKKFVLSLFRNKKEEMAPAL